MISMSGQFIRYRQIESQGRAMDLFTPKQTYGYHCASCSRLWDAYQVPCPMDEALAHMKANATCACGSSKVLVVMPKRYAELKMEKGAA